MQHYHYIEKINVTLINFKKIFASIQTKFLGDCNDYGLIIKNKINYTKTDTKRLLLHHTIHEVCEEILGCKSKGKKVIVFRPLEDKDTFEILQFSEVSQLNALLLKVIKKISRLLPIQIAILIGTASFQDIKEKLNTGSGEATEIISNILCGIDKNTPISRMNFANIKTFVKKNKLTFLSKEYFDKLKTKQLLFS